MPTLARACFSSLYSQTNNKNRSSLYFEECKKHIQVFLTFGECKKNTEKKTTRKETDLHKGGVGSARIEAVCGVGVLGRVGAIILGSLAHAFVYVYMHLDLCECLCTLHIATDGRQPVYMDTSAHTVCELVCVCVCVCVC